MYVWKWSGNHSSILSIYYNSLNSEYSLLTDSNHPDYQKNTQADYYRIAIKGLLLQLIHISHALNHSDHHIYLLK